MTGLGILIGPIIAHFILNKSKLKKTFNDEFAITEHRNEPGKP